MLPSLSDAIVDAVTSHLGVERARVAKMVAPPTKGDAGDLCLPCFQFAKALGQTPPQLAQDLAGVVHEQTGIEAIPTGPFLNFRLPTAAVAAQVIPAIEADPTAALRLTSGTDKTICIDFSSPNIAKHLAFHHIRSTMIGNALAHCYAAAGWQVQRINFLGDWGTAFGRLIAGWKREGRTLEELDEAADKVTFLNDLYVRISKAAKEDEAVMDEARAWSKKLEDGDEEARELWQTFKEASLKEFHKIYDLLDVAFDSWKGEAHYEDKMEPILDELESKGLLIEDEGALVVDLSDEGFKKPCLIKRADGGTLYATRDLTACQDRFDAFAFDLSLYVVDLGQGLHFKEWFAVAKKLGKSYADHLRHVGFGVVLMWSDEEQAFSRGGARKGNVVLLTDVLDEAITRAKAIIDEKNPELPDEVADTVARQVGVGAVVFNDLKNNRKSDVKFRFEDALNMQGDTGPYLQFAHARLCSIERKFAESPAADVTGKLDLLTRDDEKQVLLQLTALGDALGKVVDTDEPNHLANALLNLATAVSSWLTAGNKDQSARVIGVEPSLSAARIRLVRVSRTSLGEGLRLLGLQAPERM